MTADLIVDPMIVQRLLFARLLVEVKKPLADKQVLSAVASAIAPPLSASAAMAAATDAMNQCLRAGQIGRGKSAGGKDGKLTLTDEGRDALRKQLGVATLPRIKRWADARKWVAFGVIGRAASALGKHQAPELYACALAAKQGMGDARDTLAGIIDRMAWRALGSDRDDAFSAAAVQRHLFRDLVPSDARVSTDRWQRMLAMRVLGADKPDVEGLLRALLAGRVVVAGNDNDAKANAQPTLADFARAVMDAAKSPTVARFHSDRAFIGSIWEHMHGTQPVFDMPLEEFKHKLVQAHRARLLRITRADLVAAMDPREVERSEARYQDATFHFVALDAGGM